jgi:hypothetical protein
MERLVMSPEALDDRDTPGRPRRSLPARVVRRPQVGAGHAPAWVADARFNPQGAPLNGVSSSNGKHPRPDSAGGYSGYTPDGSPGARR